MEIATIAAMLLGGIADDRKYAKACEEAGFFAAFGGQRR